MAASPHDQDSRKDWLLSSPSTTFVSNMDLRQHLPESYYLDAVNTRMVTRVPVAYQISPHQARRQLSISSESSAPDLVEDIIGTYGSDTSYDDDDYEYHTSGVAIWDSWLAKDSGPSASFHTDPATIRSPLRTQCSNLSSCSINFATPNLKPIYSSGDLHRSYVVRPPHHAVRPPEKQHTYSTPPPLLPPNPPPRDTRETWPLRNESIPFRPRSHTTSLESGFRSTSNLSIRTAFEPHPLRTCSRNSPASYSLSTLSLPQCERQQPFVALPTNLREEKSVFEDWDEPKAGRWLQRNHKRKRRLNSGNAAAGKDGEKNSNKEKKNGGGLRKSLTTAREILKGAFCGEN
jgi:hypothetical protein